MGIRAFVAVFCISLCASTACAQTSQPLNRTIPIAGGDYYLFRIDFGATSQSITVTVNVTTTTSTGMVGQILELDGSAATPMPFNDAALFGQDGRLSPGAISPTINTRSYSGTHDFVVYFNATNNPSPMATDYSGTISVSAGTIVQVVTDFRIFPGPQPVTSYEYFDRWFSYFADHTSTAVRTYDLYLDLGSTPRSANLSFNLSGYELAVVQVQQMNGAGAGTYLYNVNFSAMTTVNTGAVLATGIESGVIHLRVTSNGKMPLVPGAYVN